MIAKRQIIKFYKLPKSLQEAINAFENIVNKQQVSDEEILIAKESLSHEILSLIDPVDLDTLQLEQMRNAFDWLCNAQLSRGAAINYTRKCIGLTTKELAEKIGTTLEIIEEAEMGYVKPIEVIFTKISKLAEQCIRELEEKISA